MNLEEQRRTAEVERVRFAALIETMRDAVLVVDRAGRTVISNEAFVRLFEDDSFRPESEVGEPFDARELHARVSAGESFSLSFSVPTSDGRRRWYDAHARPVPAETGIGDGGILIVHDTTDRSLRRLQEEFVGIVAHELRTPLTALRGYLQMLQRRGVDDRERRIVVLAIEQADRLQRLVEELLDATRVERGRLTIHPEPTPLGALIDETIEIARSVTEGRRFEVDRENGEIVADVDPGRIQQVLLNLLMNAVVHASDSPAIEVRLRRLRRRAEIEVADHGPGIPPDVKASLFAPFQQGQRAHGRVGLGLGLYITREIVVAHGGTIEVDTEPNQGTTFTVRLPLVSGRADNGTGEPSASALVGSSNGARRSAADDGHPARLSRRTRS